MPTQDQPVDFATQRQTMVDCQIRTFDVTDQNVVTSFLDVPRENFVPGALKNLAYSDAALDLRTAEGEIRHMLAPMVLARMVQGAGVQSGDRILDVAGGAGYSAAILAGLAREVVALESIPSLASMAARNFAELGLKAISVCAPLDASEGVSGLFDVILINGTVEAGLEPLLAKLALGGRLIAIEKVSADRSGKAGRVTRFEKFGKDASRRVLFEASAPILAPFSRHDSFVF
jgi:protein-L-isoaspartate(D-aspartate) O-methyltransferase